jgi:glycosyltransferase involved in cell wall biosynthesis
MDTNKVLFLTYYFAPMGKGGTFRSLKFIKYLPFFNWAPIVLTIKKRSEWVMDETLLNEIPKNTRIYRTAAPHPRKFFSMLSRLKLGRIANLILRFFFFPDPEILWYPFAKREALSIYKAEGYSIVYSSSGPVTSHLIAYYLKKKLKVKWVADLRDAMFEEDKQWYRKHFTPFHRYLARKIEEIVYLKSDHVIANTEENMKNIISKWNVSDNNISYIPNGYDEEDFRGISKNINNDKFIMSYIGDFYGGKSSPQIILEALNIIKENSPDLARKIQFNIIGSSRHVKEIKNMDLSNVVHDIGYVDYVQSLKYMLNSDLLIVFLPDSNVSYWVPQKVYQYIRSNVPILGIMKDGCCADIICKSNSGKVVKHNTSAILNAIVEFYNNRDKKEYIRNKEYMKQFERKYLTSRLAKIFDELVKK